MNFYLLSERPLLVCSCHLRGSAYGRQRSLADVRFWPIAAALDRPLLADCRLSQRDENRPKAADGETRLTIRSGRLAD